MPKSRRGKKGLYTYIDMYVDSHVNINTHKTPLSYMSLLIIFDENGHSVAKNMACFVCGVCLNPDQEFCFYISPVPYHPFLLFPAKEYSHASMYVVFCRWYQTKNSMQCPVKAEQVSSAPQTQSFLSFPPDSIPLFFHYQLAGISPLTYQRFDLILHVSLWVSF